MIPTFKEVNESVLSNLNELSLEFIDSVLSSLNPGQKMAKVFAGVIQSYNDLPEADSDDLIKEFIDDFKKELKKQNISI